ncbi:MAG: hypothetical protein ACREQN_11770 [Candidatus Binataceae bacterium]
MRPTREVLLVAIPLTVVVLFMVGFCPRHQGEEIAARRADIAPSQGRR